MVKYTLKNTNKFKINSMKKINDILLLWFSKIIDYIYYMKAVIIGAGITGVTTAYFLSQNNIDVTLIESRRYPAMATSYTNGGQLSASNAEAWNSWHNVKVG